jgi:hypothetical protein
MLIFEPMGQIAILGYIVTAWVAFYLGRATKA